MNRHLFGGIDTPPVSPLGSEFYLTGVAIVSKTGGSGGGFLI